MGVPRFALIETGGPDPRALLLSIFILASLVSSSIILGRFPRVIQPPHSETVTLLVEPPEPLSLPDISTIKNPGTGSMPIPPSPEPVTASLPSPELPESQPAPLKAEPAAPEVVVAETVPLAVVEKAPPLPIPPERTVAATPPPAAPAVVEAPRPDSALRAVNPAVTHELKPEPETAAPTRAAAPDTPKAVPESLGALPLRELLADQEGLAASLAALPSAERRGLPRVSVRVNAEWLAALPKTQERLYFSITTPEADGEVLAYVPGSQSFNLERPERPLWRIYDGERVPALAELRAAAGRWLGVSPNLVGLYTWHPPVFEDALQMFVLERIQELHMHLGPRDVVTVRLASGSEGAIMNLEPIREDASP
jgi:hypothetical protein